jgi:predicted dehydrogenase
MVYRCAFLGCGPRAAGHAQAYRRIRRGTPVACCDLDRARLDAFADRFNIPQRYIDLDEMLRQARPDVVHLVTRPNLRVELMTRLSDAGVPAVIVEKPICVGADDYAALRALERQSTTKFAVNHQLRHHPMVLDFLRRVQEGEIGEVKMLDASAGLSLAGQGVHILDLLFAFCGYAGVERVVGMASGYDDIDGTHPGPRTTTAVLTFRGGARGILHAGEGYPVNDPDPRAWMHKRIAVYGTHGCLHWRMGGWERSQPNGTVARGELDYGVEDEQGQAALTESVFDWLDDDAAVAPTNLKTSLDEWEVILGIYLSAVEGRPVSLPCEPPLDLLERFKRMVNPA